MPKKSNAHCAPSEIPLPVGLGAVKPLSAFELKKLAAKYHARLGAHVCGIFAYGSLIWQHPFQAKYQAAARIYGFSRKPCVLSTTYRGTVNFPGPVYGLDCGGSCTGFVLGLPRRRRLKALLDMFTQEIFLRVYRPQLVVAHHINGSKQQTLCLTFVVNHASPHYLRDIPTAQLRRMVRTARGRRGTCYEYWRQTLAQLQLHGIRWQLGQQIIA